MRSPFIVVIAAVCVWFGCAKHYDGPPQTALSFFSDLDEIVFECSRSFHGTIIVRLKRDRAKGKVRLETEVVAPGEDATPRHTEKEVSSRVFDDMEREITRKDFIEASLIASEIPTDGSVWSVSGRKGDLTLMYSCANPVDSDERFTFLGRRFLDLAGIKIPKDEVY